jgi:Flp pilus assembly protein TadG
MSMTTSPTRRLPAQALIEFMLILPVVLIILLGGIDTGRALVYGVAVQDGARDAARLAATAAVDHSVTDTVVLTRLIAASSPALDACKPISPAVLATGAQPVCPWTFTISVVTPTPTTYSGIATAVVDPAFAGSQMTVAASGSVSMLSGFRTAWGLQLFPITAQGKAVMVVW